MTTTYLATAALGQLRHAQAELDRHVAAGADGRCLTCGEDEPCDSRRLASSTFARYKRLPARRPGLASRGLVDRTTFGWFTDPAGSG